MAKPLKDILKGVKASKEVQNTLGGYKPKAGDEEAFAKKHTIQKWEDRVGNGDDVYNASNVKHAIASGKEARHGYKNPEDEKVNEETKCNMSEAGSYCPVHEYAACKSEKMLKEKGVKEESEIEEAWIVKEPCGKTSQHPNQKMAIKHARQVGGKVSATHGAGGKKASEVLGKKNKVSKFGPWGMREEVEQVDEVLSKKAPAGEWIKDFQKSDNPKFAGKSKEKRKQMALAAYYAKQRNEEAEIEEEKQYIEVINRHTGAKKHVEVHPSKAFAALNQYKKSGDKARIVSKPVKEDLAVPLLGSKEEKKKRGAKEQTGPDTPLTLPNMSVDVNTGRNV